MYIHIHIYIYVGVCVLVIYYINIQYSVCVIMYIEHYIFNIYYFDENNAVHRNSFFKRLVGTLHHK